MSSPGQKFSAARPEPLNRARRFYGFITGCKGLPWRATYRPTELARASDSSLPDWLKSLDMLQDRSLRNAFWILRDFLGHLLNAEHKPFRLIAYDARNNTQPWPVGQGGAKAKNPSLYCFGKIRRDAFVSVVPLHATQADISATMIGLASARKEAESVKTFVIVPQDIGFDFYWSNVSRPLNLLQSRLAVVDYSALPALEVSYTRVRNESQIAQVYEVLKGELAVDLDATSD